MKTSLLTASVTVLALLHVLTQAVPDAAAAQAVLNLPHAPPPGTALPNLPETEQLKKFLGYYNLPEADRKEFDEAFVQSAFLTPIEWAQLTQRATVQGYELFQATIRPDRTEWLQVDSSSALRGAEFIETPRGVVYSKVLSRRGSRVESPSPLLIGGGFPFNQTQFTAFNERVARVADLDLYDALCTGMSVYFDATRNQGRACRPYVAASPLLLIEDELAFHYARSVLLQYAAFRVLGPTVTNDLLFRLTRLTFRGISLTDQAIAIKSIADQRGYASGEALFSGISYGGLIGAKIGALFPGRFKALILVSPGVRNPAHEFDKQGLSVALELWPLHRRAIRNLIRDTAFSPRYDAYRPECLKDHDQAFRDSLQIKMLGELDIDLALDLAHAQDRVYMITGALDASVDPKKQLRAMREVFTKYPIKGSSIIVPKGGHALWGNPAQAQEEAIARSFEEIEKGASGAFQDGGVYVWNERNSGFDLLGRGLDGLRKAEVLIDQLKAAAPEIR